jgi:hypothetical protein
LTFVKDYDTLYPMINFVNIIPSEITKAEAIKKDLSKFFTRTPCCNGHIAPRYVSSGKCVACVQLYENSPKGKAVRKAYKKVYDKTDKAKAAKKAHNDARREKINELKRKYTFVKDMPEEDRVFYLRHRLHELGNGHELSLRWLLETAKAQDYKDPSMENGYFELGQPTEKRTKHQEPRIMSFDRKEPGSNDGGYTEDNVRLVMCGTNRALGDFCKYPEHFLGAVYYNVNDGHITTGAVIEKFADKLQNNLITTLMKRDS